MSALRKGVLTCGFYLELKCNGAGKPEYSQSFKVGNESMLQDVGVRLIEATKIYIYTMNGANPASVLPSKFACFLESRRKAR